MMEYKFRGHHWIAAISFIIFFLLLNSTQPFLFPRGSVRWYHMLFLCVITFLFYHHKIKWYYLGINKKLYYLIFIIILVNIIRYPFEINNNFGLLSTVISCIILIPFLSNPNARKILFFTFIYIAVLKVLLVHQYSSDEIHFRELSGQGKSKNYIGMLFSMVIIMMLSRLGITTYVKKIKFHVVKNLVIIVFILLLLYSLFISGSRSATFALILSIIIILYLFIVQFGVKAAFLRTIFISSFLLIIGLQLYPQMADKYYVIGENFARIIEFINGERDDINNRAKLFYSGIEFIKEKPIFGHGIAAEQRISELNFHNTYLTFWVNMGVFGILFLIILIKYYWDEVIIQVKSLKRGEGNAYDFSLLVGLLPFFIMFFTLGMTTIIYFISALLSSFTYERFIKTKIHNNLL